MRNSLEIEVLDISKNCNIGGEGWKEIMKFYFEENHSFIREIDFNSCWIDEERSFSLGEELLEI
jgi:hypothetical protein